MGSRQDPNIGPKLPASVNQQPPRPEAILSMGGAGPRAGAGRSEGDWLQMQGGCSAPQGSGENQAGGWPGTLVRFVQHPALTCPAMALATPSRQSPHPALLSVPLPGSFPQTLPATTGQHPPASGQQECPAFGEHLRARWEEGTVGPPVVLSSVSLALRSASLSQASLFPCMPRSSYALTCPLAVLHPHAW